MEYFDDDIISNMNRVELKKKPNIFDDLLGGDDEAEQVNVEDDIFLGDERKISNNELLFRSNYNEEKNLFEDESMAEEVIFGIGRRREEVEEGREDEVDIGKSQRKKMSDPFDKVGKMNFHDFSNSFNENEFDTDLCTDSKFENNEDIFSFSKFNRCANKGEDEKGDEENKKVRLSEKEEEEALFLKEANLKEEVEPEQKIAAKEDNISQDLFGINEANQIDRGNLNIGSEVLGEEEFQFEKLSLNNDKTKNPNIQDNKELNEFNKSDEREFIFPEKSEGERSETNMSDHNFSYESEEANNHFSAKNNSGACMESRKVRKSSNLQSSIEDIDWNRVLKIIENFEKQTGNSGRNQMLFKSIIYKLVNKASNN
ncbi:uncharacterized protein ELE39_001887 [Cryptosporidium sp. chipmunk genotype I]|uniref:uncharacterized protein n=1 Tax=Cryptosporidium sp. chipmunk genotype I TaxID=1280935 RepID=UPI00351A8312|nr:hypothetical protein ELE39_001887 [Cryptosporidium sp. chipmunk genotype I]